MAENLARALASAVIANSSRARSQTKTGASCGPISTCATSMYGVGSRRTLSGPEMLSSTPRRLASSASIRGRSADQSINGGATSAAAKHRYEKDRNYG